jgi:hypothetical protein
MNSSTPFANTSYPYSSISTLSRAAPASMIFAPDDPNFYRQFSTTYHADETDRINAVRKLEAELHHHEIVGLELKPQTCPELTGLIINNINELLCRRAPYREKAFFHLIKSINKFQNEIKTFTKINANKTKIESVQNFLQSLLDNLLFLNDGGYFTNLDLIDWDLNSLNFETLNLNLSGSNLPEKKQSI